MTNNRLLPLTLCCLVVLLLSTSWVNVVTAQVDSLIVVIEWPNEGETLYAGPSSLLYKVPIKGRVTSDQFAASELTVELEIFKDASSIGTLTAIPDENGYYELFVTINPDGPMEQFEIAFVDCGVACHSPAEIDLQSGRLTLQVTANDPAGRSATAERNITVDISDFATVPVLVRMDDEDNRPVSDVDVLASTWLYMWRSRFASGRSDATGLAEVRVEALDQAPTEYVFKIDPTIVDGVLYEGVDPVEVVLEPGARTHPPIELAVTARQGHISGSLDPPDAGASTAGVPVWAIRLPAGSSFQTITSENGRFDFSQLPLDQYLITLDNSKLVQANLVGSTEEINLSAVVETSLTMPLKLEEGSTFSGRVTDEQGDPLPFSWAMAEGLTGWQSVLPGFDGQFLLTGLPSEAVKVLFSAPGYYSRVIAAEAAVASGASPSENSSPGGDDFSLIKNKETVERPWGAGEIVIPAGTDLRERDGALILERGWLWGQSDSQDPVTIRVDSIEIAIDRGDMALEFLPGNLAWFYLFQGTAELSGGNLVKPIPVEPGQMVNLLNEQGPEAVPLDPAVIGALERYRRLDVPLVWQPTLGAQIRDRIAWIGVGTAQVVTFVTYFVLTLSIILVPLLGIFWWRRRRHALRAPEH